MKMQKAISRKIQYRPELNGNTISLSVHSGQYRLLQMTLNYCSTTGQFDKSILKKNVESFIN